MRSHNIVPKKQDGSPAAGNGGAGESQHQGYLLSGESLSFMSLQTAAGPSQRGLPQQSAISDLCSYPSPLAQTSSLDFLPQAGI